MIDQIVVILVALLIIAFPIGLVFGIVWAIKVSREEDKIKKTKGIWISLVCILGPIIFLAMTVSLWGLSAILAEVFSN